MLFKKILIANRGEIALRIMRTCKQLGISTVAVYADPDADAPFVAYADEAVALGGNTAADSYLAADKILAAARQTHADAIHPGYGFLSENSNFAQQCAAQNLVFIGPNPQAMAELGLKNNAKAIAQKEGIPTIPGYSSPDQRLESLIAAAEKLGYPLLLKAAAGGGGKGMRVVYHSHELSQNIAAAQREALAAFSDSTLIMERYFESTKHIEIQIIGDQHGNLIHCFERECSIQRRYQKIIEECPSSALSLQLRHQMCEAAISLGKTVGYDNAGTVEFLVTPDGSFYFLEVNTRLQVEHPTTEMATGIDLVRLQIAVAQGQPLPITQEDVQLRGHAIELRICAEDPAHNFMPVTGNIALFHTNYCTTQQNLRLDSGIATGSTISVYYDSMLAKLIALGENRAMAIRQLQYALRHTALLGVTSNIEFLQQLIECPQFITGNVDTQFLDRQFQFNPNSIAAPDLHRAAIAALLFDWRTRKQAHNVLQALPSGWRNNPFQPQTAIYSVPAITQNLNCQYTYNDSNNSFAITIDDSKYIVWLHDSVTDTHSLCCLIDNHLCKFSIIANDTLRYIHQPSIGNVTLKAISPFAPPAQSETHGGYQAPMPSEVAKIWVKTGDLVEAGQELITLISMKIETTLVAHQAGIVDDVLVTEKSFVESGTLLLRILPKIDNPTT